MRKKEKGKMKRVPFGLVMDLTRDYSFKKVRLKGFYKTYLRRLSRRAGKDVFKEISLPIHGGINEL